MLCAVDVMRAVPFAKWDRPPIHTRRRLLIEKPSNVWGGTGWRVWLGQGAEGGLVYYSNAAVAAALLELEYGK